MKTWGEEIGDGQWPGSGWGELQWMCSALEGRFRIQDWTLAPNPQVIVRVQGICVEDSASLFAELDPICCANGCTLYLQRSSGQCAIILYPQARTSSRGRVWLPLLLAVLTIASMLFAYWFYWAQEGDGSWFGEAVGFTACLLSILGAHEFGHWVVARKLGVAVSYPHFIPFPISPFGTMGALISMRQVPPSRRAMLLIGLAGPLAGLVVTLPVLMWGLGLSQVSSLPAEAYALEGNSLLYLGAKWLTFGRFLPAAGQDVILHPIAFAGWAGILVTSLNLLPAGQLDGGHISRALFGRKARYVTWVIVAVLCGLGVRWSGWFYWAAVIAILPKETPPRDDVTPLTLRERAWASLMAVIFVLIFTPLPMRIVG